MADEAAPGHSALARAQVAYCFLLRCLVSLLKTLSLPIAATGVVVYLSLSAYLSELIQFIGSGDPRVASLALGALAAGIFISIFCLSIGVSAVVNLALGRPSNTRWGGFRANRQEWRLYAAYLRFLLLTVGLLSADYLLALFVLPLITSSSAAITIVAIMVATAGLLMLWTAIGFLIAPVVAHTTGPVLRKAFQAGAPDLPRNMRLTVFLSIPGLLIQIGGEYLLRSGAGPARVITDVPILTLARSLQHRLPEFVVLSSLSAFVTVALFTAASIFCYRDDSLAKAALALAPGPVAKLDSAPV